ncbi:MAG: hypothetical protein ACK4SZ_03015 [Allosphingosinicella sp.]|uniref:hypothetical protein n=1 Tax=Allosphingosinicella sp. TaxID=2823234 RepID=UPI00394B4F6C
MTHLAKEFALSDVALHKICRKHDIPKPPVGWWAKKAAGKKVNQTPLPVASRDISDRITIAGGELRNEPQEVATVREQARVRASSTLLAEPRSDPIVTHTIARLRSAKTGPNGLVAVDGAGLIKCEVASSSADRLETILNGVVAASAQQGFRLDARNGSARFVGEEESVGFSITEVVRRVKHELTDKERAEEERWNRKRERARLRNEWGDVFFSRPRAPEWEWHPTGQLSFELEHVYVWKGTSPRRSFRDGKVQRVETMAADIAVGLAVLAAAKSAERLRREEEHRRAEELRRLREAALRGRHVEERRRAALEDLLRKVEQAARLRHLLAALHETQGELAGPRVAEFVRWAETRLAELEATVAAPGLERRFTEQRLFGDDDDHGFRPPVGW